MAVLRGCADHTEAGKPHTEYKDLAAQTVFGLLDVLYRWCKLHNNKENGKLGSSLLSEV